jgi:hypothetical protein
MTAKKTAGPDPWLTPAQMTEELGISKRTWARMRTAGTAPKCVRLPGGLKSLERERRDVSFHAHCLEFAGVAWPMVSRPNLADRSWRACSVASRGGQPERRRAARS